MRLAVPVLVTSFSPSEGFTLMCETFWVSNHGCNFKCPKKLLFGETIRLDIPHSGRQIKARVVRTQAKELPDNPWEVCVELEKADNFWGIQQPPKDWANGSSENTGAAGEGSSASDQAGDASSAGEGKVVPISARLEKARQELFEQQLSDLKRQMEAEAVNQTERIWNELREKSQQYVAELNEKISDLQAKIGELEQGAQVAETPAQFKSTGVSEEAVETKLEQIRGMLREEEASLREHLLQEIRGRVAEGPSQQFTEEDQARFQQTLGGLDASREQMDQLRALIGPGERLVEELKHQVQEWSEKLPQQEAHYHQRLIEATSRAEGFAGDLERNLSERDAEVRERIQQATAQAELVREQSQNLLGSIEEKTRAVSGLLREEMQALGKQLTGGMRQELAADAEAHRSSLHSEIEAQHSRLDQMRAQAEAVAGSVEETVKGRLNQMTEDLADQLRHKLETQLQGTSHELLSRVEGELVRVASAASQPAERAAADLRRQVEEWNEKLPRQEVRLQQLLSDATSKAENFNLKLDNQVRQFEGIVRDKMLETTGQLKGKMEYAIESTQARLDARGRDLQAQLEAVASRQQEASEKIIAEIEGRLRSKLDEVEQALRTGGDEAVTRSLKSLEQQSQEMATQYSRKLEVKIGEALEAVSHILRYKLSSP